MKIKFQNSLDLEDAMSQVAGSARSMGVEVEK
jgi:ribosomal protein L11